MNSSNCSDLQRVGSLVHAEERRHVVVVEMLRDRLVGEQHELLDDPVRDVPLGGDDASTSPASSITISGSGRSKSIDPRRWRRVLRTPNSSCIDSKSGTSGL
jgi:hypothetical protein